MIILAIVIGIPLLLWTSWLLTTPRQLSIITVNKSVIDPQALANQGYNWALTHRKYVNADGLLYEPARDYWGFQPLDGNNFRIRDFSNLPPGSIGSVIEETDFVFFLDNYGVYSHDWYRTDYETMPYYMLYGGLDYNDVTFIRDMLRRQKTVLAEFNFFGEPTPEPIRKQAEQLLHIQWQGWTGRFIQSLKPTDTQYLPSWLIRLYREQNQGRWDYTENGIALIHEDNTVVVLEYPTHLTEPAPNVLTDVEGRNRFGLPRKVAFPGWFDITEPTSSHPTVISWYELPVNEAGEALLRRHNIPRRFPAVIESAIQGRFFYFSGDFGKTEVPRRFSKFKGARYAELFLTDLRDPTNRKGFFFAYYLPLITNIMKETWEEKQEQQN